ncbi:hypothetical protein K1T71_008533 [Dendrolimus kikuchii]|uniref:Uncharacterized protein n=1 Tax=Dendrolimus kikuchii TaxID=765133 RepID=A0ACC1CV89_9NEOP|nr:hypothetical protein K1T71_008533 [Dendrolimus kikuchii]
MVGKHQRLQEYHESILEDDESREDVKTVNESKWCYKWRILIVSLLALLIGFICFVYLFYDTGVVTDLPIVKHIDNEKVVSCYYNTPNPQEPNQLLPSNIYPFLCTHINVAFARVVNKEIYLEDSQYSALEEVVKLKQQNPKLKVLLSVGGSRNNDGFSEMVVNHASRKTFIRSIKQILLNYSLDGIDLDWEFPAMSLDSDSNHRERQHFSQLLREIRMEYIREKRNYLLTIAAAAPETIVDVSYDIDQINTYVDYVNIMTYDFHYYTNFTPFTGHNSPLYARATEQLFLATLNINYTVHMYLRKGLDSRKIVVGIPTYGHSFKLVNSNNPNVGSPASGFGTLGANGFVNFPDICMFLNKYKSETTLKYDSSAKVPYLFRDQEWVSFDYPQSATDKALYIVDNNLRGAMVYSLNADDYQGVCGAGSEGNLKFPLLHSVKNTLNSTNAGQAVLRT